MEYQETSRIDKLFNKAVGLIAGSRFAPGDLYLLVFYGRKTGNRYTTPVFMMRKGEINYLVAPRGETQWVKNVRKLNTLILKRGRNEQEYNATEVVDAKKAEILMKYYEKYQATVKPFFPEDIDNDLKGFEEISDNYPIFKIE
jgi:deazaflavin-dependent oxidoreductase (nitroreductase family)